MSSEIIAALIGLLGVIVGAIPTYIFMRQKNMAEVEKLRAETEKIKAEAEKIRTEIKSPNLPTAPTKDVNITKTSTDTTKDKNSVHTKILFIAANPTDTARLQLALEVRSITESLIISPNGDSFKLINTMSARWEDFRRLLLLHNPDILHISGHATKEGIILEDSNGHAYNIPPKSLDTLLSGFSDKIRLLIINANESSEMCRDLAQRIDFTIGIDGYISDKQAIEFAKAFYESIANGKDIKTSFDIARSSVKVFGDKPDGAYQIFNYRQQPEKNYFV